MKCDKDGCEEDAVSFGQGFEPGKEVSSRCRDHAWTLEERKAMIESHARSRQAWDSLTEAERAFVVETEAGKRNQVFQAIAGRKEGESWE